MCASLMSLPVCNFLLGRYDLRLPDYVIEQLGLVEALQPILSRLETIMGTPKPQLRTHNVVFVPVGVYNTFFSIVSSILCH